MSSQGLPALFTFLLPFELCSSRDSKFHLFFSPPPPLFFVLSLSVFGDLRGRRGISFAHN